MWRPFEVIDRAISRAQDADAAARQATADAAYLAELRAWLAETGYAESPRARTARLRAETRSYVNQPGVL